MSLCRCQTNEVDTRCGTGIYLIGKIVGINGVMEAKGFLDLSDYTRERVSEEYERWVREYFAHVEKEGLK